MSLSMVCSEWSLVEILLLSYFLTIILIYIDARIIQINRILGYLSFWVCLYFYGEGVLTYGGNVPTFLLAGLLGGHFLFAISLLLTKLSLKEVYKYCLPVRDIGKYYLFHPMVVINFLLIAFGEEFLWRAIIQDRFGSIYLENAYLSIVLAALLFTLLHKKNLEGDFLRKLEFFLFSLFLGYAFFMFHSLTFVTVVHTIRNVNISYRARKKEKEEEEEDIPSLKEIPITMDSPKKFNPL